MIRELFPSETAGSAFDIDYERLYRLGYRGLLFDIDNTLVHHGDDSTPEVDALFERIHAAGFRTLMLSNNNVERITRFLRNIRSDYIEEAGKPDPACYEKACEKLGLPKDQVLMIGDQLFTDIRGANRAGIASILVDFIRMPGETWLGWHRYAELALLAFWRLGKKFMPGLTPQKLDKKETGNMQKSTIRNVYRFLRKEILFCEISPLAYKISLQKEILKRNIKDTIRKEKFAKERKREPLPYVAATHSSNMIRRAPGVDLTLQENKAVNIDLACRTFNHLVIHPGETFSFWRNVGPTTAKRGYKDGRIIKDGILMPGLGGGLCNLANTLHLLVLESPLTVTELHFHSDALAPDEGPRKPFASGTSVSYSNIDFRFKNTTDQDFQIVAWCEGEMNYAALLCEHEYPYVYKLAEEDHHFVKEGDKYYRVSKIWHETYDRKTGEFISRRLLRDNHSEVMYDPAYIPKELLRE